MTISTEYLQEKSGRAIRTVRVFVIEDQVLLRLGICVFLTKQPGLQCCGESGSDDDSVLALDLDLVLLGTPSGDPGGAAAVSDLRDAGFSGKIIVLADRENASRAEAALRRGASGYLTKDESPEVLSGAIQTVMKGEIAVADDLRTRLVNQFSAGKSGSESPRDLLTNREYEVLELIGAGLKTQKIARRLGVSSKTVNVHRANIKRKLEIDSLNQLIRFAVREFG